MPEKDIAARKLAAAHYSIEPGITHIFKLRDAAEAESLSTTSIKLLEVNSNTSSSGILPLHFGAAPASGIPFPSVILEVTPDEFEQIKIQQLKLPDGWFIDEELPKGSD